MSWTEIKTTGRGTLRFALVIEGWPELWVSDPSVTYAPDGAVPREGLCQEGITIQDRVIMQDARVEQQGITFKIRPNQRRQDSGSGTQWYDDPTLSFSQRVDPVGRFTDDLPAAATTAPAFEGPALADGVYWVGSEAIEVDTFPTIIRGAYSSIDQSHFAPTEPDDAELYVWPYPPTMEGRRVKLYVWGTTDSASVIGTLVWRGIVSRPPRLSGDNQTWEIPCQGIVAVLKQKLAGDLTSANVVGIYHHANCALRVRVRFGDTVPDPVTFAEWHADEAAMMTWVTEKIADQLTLAGATTFIASCKMTRDTDGAFRIELITGSSGADIFALEVSSPIIGGFFSSVDLWTDADTGEQTSGGTAFTQAIVTLLGGNDTLSYDSTYYGVLKRPHDAFFNDTMLDKFGGGWSPANPMEPVSPLGDTFLLMRETSPTLGLAAALPASARRWVAVDSTQRADNPPWRIYLDQDFADVDAVAIPETMEIPGIAVAGGVWTVLNTGEDAARSFWIEVQPVVWQENPGIWGFLTGEIRARRDYGSLVDVFEFVDTVKDRALTFGNRGDTPFVTSEDMTDWAQGDGQLPSLAYRNYQFFGAVELDRMLEEECKLIGYFMRIASDGRIDVSPIPALTATSPVDATHTITGADIITPAGHYGDWPTWDPMRDGRITKVTFQQLWDALTDTWTDAPSIFMDSLATTLSHHGGKALSEIKPYSRPALPTAIAGVLAHVAGRSPPDTGKEIRELATRYLRIFAHDYDVVTVCVPFTKFDILCGDIVALTHHTIPDGVGYRGVTLRRGMVIERYWPMDPKADGYGRLTILLVQKQVGYAPSAFVTGQVNTSGTTWTLTCSTANARNIGWSTDGDGLVLQHYAAGDFVRVCKYGDATPTEVTGVISGSPNVAAGTCVVVLTGAWTPGADSWTLEYQEDTDAAHSTTSQRAYAYVADSDLRLMNNDFARRLQ